ncbi:MAG: phytochelatin synthase family protein [Pseudomonadota bacterium]
MTVALDSEQGRRMLMESEGIAACLRLLEHFVTQDMPTYCGPASAAMALNAMGLKRPSLPTHPGYQLFTQASLFNSDFEPRPHRPSIEKRGASLAEFVSWFEPWGVHAEARYGNTLSLDALREVLHNGLHEEGAALVANYYRPCIGQQGYGHFSPIGAFHRETDSFLLLDVARYRYPPVWVSLKPLHRALCEADTESGKARGIAHLFKTSDCLMNHRSEG